MLDTVGAVVAIAGILVGTFAVPTIRVMRRQWEQRHLLEEIHSTVGPEGSIGVHFADDDRPGAPPSLPRQVSELRRELREHMGEEEEWRTTDQDEIVRRVTEVIQTN